MTNQLFITEFDDVYLPPKYHLSHNIAVRLYDDLVWVLKDPEIQSRLMVRVNFNDSKKLPKEDEKKIINWLKSNGYEKEANEIIIRNALLAVISDICHFIYQALDSAKRIKMAVAFTLIRKPFLENLLIIEQMIADEEDFLKKFASSPEVFDPGKIKNEEKIKLIEVVISKIKTKYLLDPGFIFNLRFDKSNNNSFYALTNLATHLVTTRYSNSKTEKNNLNFIFSLDKEWESQLHYFYYYLPLMLFYTTEVVDQLHLNKNIVDDKVFKKRKFYRLIGQMVQFDQFDEKSTEGQSKINSLATTLKIRCNECNKINRLFKSDLYILARNKYILCKYCLIDLFGESKSMDDAMEIIQT